jgi:hypothetical protein
MKRNTFGILTLLAAGAALFFVSCGTPGTRPQTIEWASDGAGFIQYMTEDPNFFKTAQFHSYTEAHEAPMTTVTVAAKKMSGAADMGFGVIFCVQDSDNFYRVMIDTTGMYKIVKKLAGSETVIQEWATSSHLSTGYDVVNTIMITHTPPSDFSVYLGGSTMADRTFPDSSFTDGDAGFYVAIGDSTAESFPHVPEDVRFQMTAPVTIPAP